MCETFWYKKEKLSLSEITIETYLPNVFEFFLRSTATSNIFPCVTVIILLCGFCNCKCKPLKTFF